MTTVPENDHPLHAAVNAKLAEIVATSPTPPPWSDAWTRLGPQSTDQERLAVYRAVRDAGSVPPEAGFFLVAWILDLLTDERAEEGLRDVEERLDQVRQKYSLDEETPVGPGQVPLEYEEAMQQVDAAWDALYATTMEQFGEQDMARLFRENSEAFDEQYEAGRQFFHGPESAASDPDVWLDDLREDVAECMEADDPVGVLGLRYREEDGFWEIQVYRQPVELVGGCHDGEIVSPGFSLDLEQLRMAFDSVANSDWHAFALDDPEGASVHIEGVYKGREIFLQVLAQAPEDAEPDMKVYTTNGPRPPE